MCYLHGLPGDPDCVLPGQLMGELHDVRDLVLADALRVLLTAADVARQTDKVSLQG